MLKIENAQVYYGNIQALKGITVEVNDGELVALIGSNGAGKSTTLKTISGLLHPRSGKITYMDKDVTHASPLNMVISGVSHCPEGRHIFPSLSVKENLQMGAIRRKDKEGIERDMEYVFNLFPILKERLGQAGGTLSGGEQQMLAIGRSLMSQPKLILFDEPSLGLAPLMVEVIFEVISKLKADGGTILLVEQNARKALEVADRAYVMETGRIVIEGSAKECAANPEVERAYLGG